MRLGLLALALLAGGCRPPGEPPPRATVLPAQARPLVTEPSAPRLAEGPPFEIDLRGRRLCARIRERVHCLASLEGAVTRLADAPVIPGIDAAISLSAPSAGFACAVTRDGKVWCWGDNSFGQLAAGLVEEHRDAAGLVPGVPRARSVVASVYHVCAILADESVRCWGDNRAGQTSGETAYAEDARELVHAVPVPGVTGVTAIALAESATCALARGGATWCWGEPLHLPKDDPAHHASEVPAVVPALADLESITAGAGGFCGVRHGEVICWGWSLFEDHHGTIDPPRAVLLPGPARRVAVGSSHACALLADGRIACWGSNWSRALSPKDIHVATKTGDPALVVEGIPPAIEVYAGGGATCALDRANELHCWGMWPSSADEPYVSPTRVAIE